MARIFEPINVNIFPTPQAVELSKINRFLRDQANIVSSTDPASEDSISGAPDNLQYVVLEATAQLSQERVLVATDPIVRTDGGAGGNVVISLNESATFFDRFLRSDFSDNYTLGTLTFDAGTTLDVNGNIDLAGATVVGDGPYLRSDASDIGTGTYTLTNANTLIFTADAPQIEYGDGTAGSKTLSFDCSIAAADLAVVGFAKNNSTYVSFTRSGAASQSNIVFDGADLATIRNNQVGGDLKFQTAGTGIVISNPTIKIEDATALDLTTNNVTLIQFGDSGATPRLEFVGNALFPTSIFRITDGSSSAFINLAVNATAATFSSDGTSDGIAFNVVNDIGDINFIGGVGSTIRLNQSGVDCNTITRGATDINLHFVDAGTNRVGIGTSIPAAKSHIQGTVASDFVLRVEAHPSQSVGIMIVLDSGDKSMMLIEEDIIVINQDAQDHDLRVESSADANAIFLEGSNGRTGFGTGTPAAKCHVVGDIALTTGNFLYLEASSSVLGDTRLSFNATAGPASNGAILIEVQGNTPVGIGRNTVVFDASFATVSKTIVFADSPFTIVAGDKIHTLRCDAAGGSITVNLPVAATTPGVFYYIKRIDANNPATVTIDANGTETIDQSLTAVLNNRFDALLLQSDGVSNWDIL